MNAKAREARRAARMVKKSAAAYRQCLRRDTPARPAAEIARDVLAKCGLDPDKVRTLTGRGSDAGLADCASREGRALNISTAPGMHAEEGLSAGAGAVVHFSSLP